ncbi:MAG: hypothetical protein PUI75_09910 [Subdoligranulum sp.]|nr:hypothetical protein [Subdoligranulum sp.]
MLDKTSSIICAFGLAAAAPRSPYRHLELCGIALKKLRFPLKRGATRRLRFGAPSFWGSLNPAGRLHPPT